MGLAPFPDEERVRLSEKVSEKIKTSGTCDEDVSRKTVPINEDKNSVTYADMVRTRIERR